jgi:hypothetical protein
MKNPSAPQRLEQQIIRLLDDKSPARRPRRIPVAVRVILGLIAVIGAGTLTLWLVPGLTVNRISFMEALFTATSAATVTGLTVLTTSTDFTLAGQLVLLLLIQLGGVGYMFAAVLTLRLLGRRVSLMDRLALSSSLGLDTPAAILKLLKRVLIGIVLIEGVGAALLYLHWRGSGIVPAEQALLYAVFHAVSAFCNAGLDLFTGLPQYPRGIPGDDWSLIIMGLLIVVGGDCRAAAADVLRHRRARAVDLRGAGLTTQLQRRLDDLVDAGSADWMPARLEPAQRADGYAPARRIAPSCARRTPAPRSANPAASSDSAAIMLKASCSSNRSTSSGPMPAWR